VGRRAIVWGLRARKLLGLDSPVGGCLSLLCHHESVNATFQNSEGAAIEEAPPEEKISRHESTNQIYSDYVGARVKRENPPNAGFLASRHPDEEKQTQNTKRKVNT